MLFWACHTLAFAQENILDLREKDLNETIFKVDGTWQMAFESLLSAEAMQGLESKFYCQIPGSWTGLDYHGQRLPSHGFATYYKRVLVDQEIKELRLDSRRMGVNFELFVNGHSLGGAGQVGTNKETSLPSYRNRSFRLPDHNGTLDIVFHISNFHYRKGGMWRGITVGSLERMAKNETYKVAASFFLIGAILFMGLYHLGLNIYRFKSAASINFSIVCFLTVFRTLLVGEYLLDDSIGVNWFILVKLELISFYLLVAFTGRFIYYLFPKLVKKWVYLIPFYAGLGGSIFTIFAPVSVSNYLVPVMQIVTSIASLLWLIFIVRGAFSKNKEAIIAMIGFVILFAAYINEVLVFRSIITNDFLFTTGVFFFLFSYVIIMANRISTTYVQAEDLGRELQVINQELEEKVRFRTRLLDQQNEALIENNKKLLHINQEKDGLISVVAHDLKSPLNINIGLISLLKSTSGITDEQREYINMMERSNAQGLDLINDLLLLYNLEKAQEANISSFNLQQFLENCVNSGHAEMASKKSISLKCDLEGCDTTFHTDPSMLRRIIDNLISNAIKFSHPGKRIWLRAELSDDNLELVVKDEGLGIREEELGFLFKKFQQLSNKPTGDESSSGLGLSIVKQLTGLLGGTVGVTSTFGKGSEFTVSIPDKKPVA